MSSESNSNDKAVQDDIVAEESNDVVAAEQLLSNALGGWTGILDSGLPTAIFLLVFTVNGQVLQPALIAAVVTALVLAVIRVIRKKSLQQVISGLIGVAIAAWFSSRTGEAEDFFLPGILTNIAYGVGLLISVIVRHPLIGYLVGGLTGDLTSWRSNPADLRFYRLVTLWWVGMFGFRVAVQLPLYLAGAVELLGTAKLVMGWPLYLAVAFVTYRAVTARRARA